ncbi:MAG: hypothetical protein QME41_01150 [Actinomycetota bacterium]|nr:hypothetical protein [Actinomycetota bacterium]
MSLIEPKEVCELVTIEEDADFRAFSKDNPTGLVMVPEEFGESKELVISDDGMFFAKWLKMHNPEVNVEVRKADKMLALRSSDYWFPLVYLANDIALPIFLGLVANYLYDKMKGALKGEIARVQLSAEFEDQTTGTIKRFNFEGDTEALQKAIKQFDLNEFLND